MGMVSDYILLLGTNIYFLLVVYAVLGAGIKYIDAAFDEKVFNKKIATVMAPIIAILWAVTMMSSDISATILFSVVLGVLLKGKIDNIAFIIGLCSILMMIFIFQIKPIIMPLIFLTAAAVLDEVGHDVLTYNGNNLKDHKFRHQFSQYFFGRRYMMKVALIYIVLIGLFPLEFFVVFIIFDEGYIIMNIYSLSRIKKRSILNNME